MATTAAPLCAIRHSLHLDQRNPGAPTHPRPRDGCCQMGGGDRGGLGVTRAFCRRGGRGGLRHPARMHAQAS
jgi:hypothetical protein